MPTTEATLSQAATYAMLNVGIIIKDQDRIFKELDSNPKLWKKLTSALQSGSAEAFLNKLLKEINEN